MTHDERADRDRAILQYVADGHTITEATNEFGVSYSLVYSALSASGVKPIPGYPGVTSDQVQTEAGALRIVAELLNTNAEYAVIARRLGVSTQRVGEVFKAAKFAGVKFPGRKNGDD